MKHSYLNIGHTLIALLTASTFLYSQAVPDQLFGEGPGQMARLDMRSDQHPDSRALGQSLFSNSRPMFEIFSPSTNRFAGTSEGNLYQRSLSADSINVIAKPKEGWYWHAENMMWSPNGNFLVAKQIDDRNVPRIKLTYPNKKALEKIYFRAGEKIPIHQFYIVDIESGKTVAIRQDPELSYVHVVGWSEDNKSIFLIQSDRLMKKVQLHSVNGKTGLTTLLLTEASDTYTIGLNLLQGYSSDLIDMQLFTYLDESEQFVWMSERSGYNQFYLFDAHGNLVRQLTDKSTNGIVEKISGIDRKNGWVYYIAHGDTLNPYDVQVFRTSLDRPRNEKIINGPLVSELPMFIDNYDSLYVMRDALPDILQMELYRANGDFEDKIWEGNLEVLKNNSLHYAYERVLAADNSTMLESLVLRPDNFDPTIKYPVVEYIYGAAFMNVLPRYLSDNNLWEMQALANEGYIVVFIDGRGTAQRGKAFRDFGYGKFGQVEIQDHVAVLKQLAKKYTYMDMDKVGIMGHSWGGYFTLRALIEAPDFYKVGLLAAGAVDPIDFRVAIEPFMGCLPQDCPEKYKTSQITDKLAGLKAPLKIIHGTADDDVPISESYKLIKKLDEIGYRKYEFVVLEGIDHSVYRHADWPSMVIDYFKKHLN